LPIRAVRTGAELVHFKAIVASTMAGGRRRRLSCNEQERVHLQHLPGPDRGRDGLLSLLGFVL
jgi:hypothetical protein